MAILKKHYFRIYAAGVGPYAALGLVDDEATTQDPSEACQIGIDMAREYEPRDLFWAVLTEKVTRSRCPSPQKIGGGTTNEPFFRSNRR
jgi:hypothetical protein